VTRSNSNSGVAQLPCSDRCVSFEPAAFTKVSALGVEEQRVNVVADLITPVSERPGVGDNFRRGGADYHVGG